MKLLLIRVTNKRMVISCQLDLLVSVYVYSV
jgi:hypothetical protein